MRIIILIITLIIPDFLFSQDDPPKMFDHYASVQVNKLIKEVINLNSNNNLIDNPYLLEYSLIHNKSNFGLSMGFGYTYSQEKDHENPDGKYIEENDLSFFIGVCKRQMLGKKVELSYGLDYVNNYVLNKSYSNSVTEFGNRRDSSYFQVKDESKAWGMGFDVIFRFYLSRRILIGSQLNCNYMMTEEKSHSLTYTESTFNSTSLEVDNSGTDHKDFLIHLPVAIFLTIKF
jgi:hypothetical protein